MSLNVMQQKYNIVNEIFLGKDTTRMDLAKCTQEKFYSPCDMVSTNEQQEKSCRGI